jgi:hypothetical protein
MVRMAGIAKDRAAIGGIPYLHRLVPGGRSNLPAIRGPPHEGHAIGMALIDCRRRTGGGIPYADTAIGTRGAVGRGIAAS